MPSSTTSAPAAQTAADDLAEVGLGVFEVLTAECVVPAELDDKNVGRLLQDPVDAGQPAGGGVAADAGVDDIDGVPVAAKDSLDDSGEGVGLGETEPGGEAVAEHDDAGGGDLR